MPNFRLAFVLAFLSCTASACGGGASSGTVPNTTQPPTNNLAGARLVIVVPAVSPSASRGRRPQYISASTLSMTIQVDTGTPTVQNLTPGSPNCNVGGGGLTCTVNIIATSASHTFTFETYDQVNAAGNPLSVNSATQALVANVTTTVAVTLAGIPKTLQITAQASPSIVGTSMSGFQFASAIPQTFVVNALDADGNIILGPGAPVLSANATSVQPGSGIAVNPVGGNPNKFTVVSNGFGTATFSAGATPTSPLAGPGVSATAALTATTITTTLAGKLNTSGFANGTGTSAAFNNPTSITFDPLTGDLYVADSNNFVIRQATMSGVVTTIAGASGTPGFANGTGASARFTGGQVGIVYAASTGNLYVSDINNCAIRAVTTAGVVTTIMGDLPPNPPACGYLDGTGVNARVGAVSGIAYDAGNGNLYIADTSNCAIRQVTTSGIVTTIAGAYPVAGCGSDVNGTGITARFQAPTGIAYDSSDGALYVTDNFDCTLRRVTTLGVVTTLAGSSGICTLTDGTGSAARFNSPNGITYDADNGNLYVSDQCAIRQVTPGGVVTTIAGSGSCFPSADGIGSNALFGNGANSGLAYVPGSTELFVTDIFGDAIRLVQI